MKELFYKDNLIGNGSIFASVSKDELYKQKIIVPSIKIESFFNQMAIDIDEKIRVLDEQTIQAQEARDRLLPKLMRGELEV